MLPGAERVVWNCGEWPPVEEPLDGDPAEAVHEYTVWAAYVSLAMLAEQATFRPVVLTQQSSDEIVGAGVGVGVAGGKGVGVEMGVGEGSARSVGAGNAVWSGCGTGITAADAVTVAVRVRV